jgi:hypothetical protein
VGPAIAWCAKNVCYLMIVRAVCSVRVLFHIFFFLQAVEYMSQLLPPGSIAQKKEECMKNKDVVKRGSCGRFLYFRDFSSESCICSVLKFECS